MSYMLEMLEWIQTIRTPFFDHLFVWITVLGEEYFAMAVVCLILWCVDKKMGYKIGIAYISTFILNIFIKEIFQIPRPFILDRNLTPIRPETATGFSFPSGHTQGIASLSTSLMLEIRRRWIYITGSVLIVLMAMSRMYLGVHTLMDVAAGAAVGIAWVYAANKIFDYTEASGNNKGWLLLLIPMLLGMVLIQTHDYYITAGMVTGILVGYFLDAWFIHYQASAVPWQKVLQFVLGLAVLMAIKIMAKKVLGVSLLADYVRYFLMGLWITVLAPLLFKLLFPARPSLDISPPDNKKSINVP